MVAARWCFLASSFLAAAALGGFAARLLAGAPDLKVIGGDLSDYNCYANEVHYPQHPCACALGTDSTHIYDYCSNARPADGSVSVPAPGCVGCPERTCSPSPLSCGATVVNCWNPQGTNKCNGGSVNTDWSGICDDTGKPDGCENKTYQGCLNGTGGACP